MYTITRGCLFWQWWGCYRHATVQSGIVKQYSWAYVA